LKLAGLDPILRYRESNGGVWGGDELMYAGVALPVFYGDFKAKLYHFTAEQEK
jgi:alpha-galactosidase